MQISVFYLTIFLLIQYASATAINTFKNGTGVITRFNETWCETLIDRIPFEDEQCFNEFDLAFKCYKRGGLLVLACRRGCFDCEPVFALPRGYKNFCTPLIFGTMSGTMNWDCPVDGNVTAIAGVEIEEDVSTATKKLTTLLKQKGLLMQ